jgi:hypothetical protein
MSATLTEKKDTIKGVYNVVIFFKDCIEISGYLEAFGPGTEGVLTYRLKFVDWTKNEVTIEETDYIGLGKFGLGDRRQKHVRFPY